MLNSKQNFLSHLGKRHISNRSGWLNGTAGNIYLEVKGMKLIPTLSGNFCYMLDDLLVDIELGNF